MPETQNSLTIERESKPSLIFLTLIFFFFSVGAVYELMTNSFEPKTFKNFYGYFFTLIISLPICLFHLWFATRKKQIFTISNQGLQLPNQQLINWKDIYEIQTNIYPGPRMRFYRITLTLDFNNNFKKRNIILSSYINTTWDSILTCLSFHTSKNNIKVS